MGSAELELIISGSVFESETCKRTIKYVEKNINKSLDRSMEV